MKGVFIRVEIERNKKVERGECSRETRRLTGECLRECCK